MIQRKQTLFLLIAAAFMAVASFTPLAQFIWRGEPFKLYAWAITSAEDGTTAIPMYYLGIMFAACAVLPLVTIFLFKNRWLQLRLCLVEMVLLLGSELLLGFFIYHSWSAQRAVGSTGLVLSIMDLFPLLALLFTYLAFRGVAKDEALIRSLDRIR